MDSPANKDAVNQISEFIEHQVKKQQQQQSSTNSINLIVGLNGPQGIGKTTLTSALALQLTNAGYRVYLLSIDDLYMTHADQCTLATTTANPLLARRGLPGTHDIDIGAEILEAFRNDHSDIRVPRYDKSLYNGEGDRCAEWTDWHVSSTASSAPRILLFEGWCLGFCPIGHQEIVSKLTTPSEGVLHRYSLNQLSWINTILERYTHAWYSFLDLFVVLEAESLDSVYVWREQQEQALRQRTGGNGMSPAVVRSFVDTFMVGYTLWLPQLLENGILIDNARRVIPMLTITFDHERRVIRTKQID
ncbi:P-loop containing nucleoside triphosphate hydrolase protein [Syncephalis plumigaleata]|nr:P-loop containing nucleoside triphosphate hydrolase protein [Syncephalis plumigaleata]